MESTSATPETIGAPETGKRFPRFSMPKFRAPKWPEKWPKPPKMHLSRPWKIIAIVLASILGLIVLAWVVLNIMLANPKTATPMINWSLHTFGAKSANITSGKLRAPFSSRFELQGLDWPGTVEAKAINLDYDLFGFLPGHPWVKKLIARDGEVMLENKKDDKRTINPQGVVDAVEIENIKLKFVRREKLREVTFIKAGGSFSSGTVSGSATSGDNQIQFSNLRREWDGSLRGDVTASGQNLKQLAEIVGASSPDTPPFKVDGKLHMLKQVWAVNGITGRMGDSDIGGDVSVDLKPKKPFLTVALKSKELDFDDLGVVFGIPIGTGKGETSNEEQKEAKAEFDRSARLIPDTHIDFARLAAVNADIKFEAVKVVDAPVGINAMNFVGTLRDQVLDFERFLVRTGSSGDLDAKVHIDATQDPAKTKATGKLDKFPIERLVKTPFVKGTLNGVFNVNFTGSGFREAFGSTGGEAGIWSTNSEVAKIATEAAGLDLGEILLLLAKNDDHDMIKSRCLAANVSFKNGIATLNPAVLDNEDSLILANGGLNLKDETMDIGITAKPHDVSIGKVFGDIKIHGSMRHPQIKALDEDTVVQGAVAALLSTVTGALAALPFLELGGEPDAPCQQLLADSRTIGKKPATKDKTDAQKLKKQG
ncbi:MAG TPA: AsmA family protein [Hyphomonadaceae bacterium]|nr:AsmA family protein [Hyphomonadaceae bacterium]